MAELFSKEYLKDLLLSGSVEGAVKTTAKAGLETLSGHIAEDRANQTESFADRILNSGDGLIRNIAQDAVDTASHALDDEGEAEGVAPSSDQGPDQSTASSTESSRADLFSKDYLKSLFESDAVTTYINEKTEGQPILQDAIAEGKDRLQSYSSLSSAPVDEDADWNEEDEEDDADEEDEEDDADSSIYEDQDSSYAPPQPYGYQQQAPPLQQSVPPGIYPQQDTRTTKKRGCLTSKLFWIIVSLLFVFWLIGSCAPSCSDYFSSATSSSSKVINGSTSSGPTKVEIEQIVAYGFVTDNEGAVDYFLVNDEEKLQEYSESTQAKYDADGKWGVPCMVVEGTSGQLWFIAGKSIQFKRAETMEGEYYSSITRLSNIVIPLAELDNWYPDRRDLSNLDSKEIVSVLADHQTISESFIYNRFRNDHDQDPCPNAVAVLQYDWDNRFAVEFYCADNGGVVYDSTHECKYDYNTNTLYLPSEMALGAS